MKLLSKLKLYNTKIEKLTRKDIPKILDLEKNNSNIRLYCRYDKKELSYIFDNLDKCEAYGIFKGDNLIGWSSYRTDWSDYSSSKNRIYEVSSVVIKKEYRRLGLATKILSKIIKDIKIKHNPREIFITVSPFNIPALILYLRSSFVAFNYKKRYYDNNDRLFMKYINL